MKRSAGRLATGSLEAVPGGRFEPGGDMSKYVTATDGYHFINGAD